MQTQTVSAARALVPKEGLYSIPAAQPLLHRIWPPAIIALGLELTIAWTGFLGYELVFLIERAM